MSLLRNYSNSDDKFLPYEEIQLFHGKVLWGAMSVGLDGNGYCCNYDVVGIEYHQFEY
jgi:hypothetical protein